MIANGAEPVSPAPAALPPLRRFQARFGAARPFRAEAMAPVYGLAECSVGLAFPPLGRVPPIDRIDRLVLAERGLALPASDDRADTLELVACGRPLAGHAIRIVDEAGREAGEREEGRIQFKGPSATRGYFGNAATTRRLFDGEWLETGDLGYLARGDLYVTGRSKDLIIRAGRHIHPQQIEDAVGTLPGVRRGCVVAVGEPAEASGTEAVIVLAETRETDPDARAALCRRIADRAAPLLGGPPEHVGLLPPHTIPKTSSGKLRRSTTLERYRGGRLEIGAGPLRRQLLGLVLLGAPGHLRAGLRQTAAWAFAARWWLVIGVAMAVMWAVVMTVPECPARVTCSGGWRALRWCWPGTRSRSAASSSCRRATRSWSRTMRATSMGSCSWPPCRGHSRSPPSGNWRARPSPVPSSVGWGVCMSSVRRPLEPAARRHGWQPRCAPAAAWSCFRKAPSIVRRALALSSRRVPGRGGGCRAGSTGRHPRDEVGPARGAVAATLADHRGGSAAGPVARWQRLRRSAPLVATGTQSLLDATGEPDAATNPGDPPTDSRGPRLSQINASHARRATRAILSLPADEEPLRRPPALPSSSTHRAGSPWG